ncbi:MAG: hypothetical protein MZU97_19025 [Bacillus subtilis]|nr:hypothetical protein [Bacillus subtilis]
MFPCSSDLELDPTRGRRTVLRRNYTHGDALRRLDVRDFLKKGFSPTMEFVLARVRRRSREDANDLAFGFCQFEKMRPSTRNKPVSTRCFFVGAEESCRCSC